MTGRKVRTKKLNIKTPLPVLREDQIETAEYDALLTESQIATGVEQAEENEFHLQSILKEAGTSNDQEIPVPPPQESKINYDDLYPSTFQQSSSYVRSSNTVEESISCPYDMTTEDVAFLKQYNGSRSSTGQLSEDEFEHIMDVYETTSSEQTPFACVDNTVIAYDAMVPLLNQLGSAHVMQHAKAIFEYWRSRRLELGNKPLHPTLKFEMHQETDDTDPYVCFRRREARQTRKTRARDVQMAEKLKRLRKELEDGRQLVILTCERERLKRDFLTTDRLIFEHRARLKDIKVRLKIKGEEEELLNQKPKRKAPEPPLVRPPPGQPRAPPRQEPRTVETDLPSLSDKMTEREIELKNEVDMRIQTHQKSQQNHIDLTWGPLSPIVGQEPSFRPVKTQYLMTPPASASGESMDVDDETANNTKEHPEEVSLFPFSAGGHSLQDVAAAHNPAFRRRFGRLNRLWIDRRELHPLSPTQDDKFSRSDRWKYDCDDEDEDEAPVYELDPFNTQALKFRTMIPLSPFAFGSKRTAPPPPQIQTDPSVLNASVNGNTKGPVTNGTPNGSAPMLMIGRPNGAATDSKALVQPQQQQQQPQQLAVKR